MSQLECNIITILALLVGAFGGHMLGKRNADRWHAKHPCTVQKPDPYDPRRRISDQGLAGPKGNLKTSQTLYCILSNGDYTTFNTIMGPEMCGDAGSGDIDISKVQYEAVCGEKEWCRP